MKIAFSTHAARSYPRKRWGGLPSVQEQDALFDWVAREGFDGLDVGDSWADFALLDQDGAKAMLRRAAERGLVVCALNCLRKTLCDTDMSEAHMKAIRHALEVAIWLECPTVSISLSLPTAETGGKAPLGGDEVPGSSATATDHDYASTALRLRKLSQQARELGIALSIELHHCSIADTSAGLLRVLAETSETNIGANPDLVNAYRAYAEPPETWQQALEALAGKVNVWHVKNVQRVFIPESKRAVFIERGLADGDIDYRWATHKLRAAGFDGWIAIENSGMRDPFELTAGGLHYLRRVIQDESLRTLATAY